MTTIEELFEDFYQNIKNDNWPTLSELQQSSSIDDDILAFIVHAYQLPDEEKDQLDKIETLCQLLKIQSIPDDIVAGGLPDSNQAFYNTLRQDTWPDYGQFVSAVDKPLEIVQELYDNFEPPVGIKVDDKFHIFRKVFNISDQVLKPIKNARIEMHNYFFWSTIDFYRTKSDFLDQLTNQYPKPLSFDVLLGRKKFHRDLVYKGIDHDKNYVTYMTHKNTDLSACNHSNFVWPAGVSSPETPVVNTAEEVVVDGTIVSLSQIIPVDIYNQTAYSLVCESLSSNSFSFFTEKTIKPMLAKRLFLVCSGQYFLHNLRSLGFKTFNGIVDESYDREWQLEKRIEMILNEVNRLCLLDQQQVYNSVQSVLDHNYQLLMNRDWQEEMIKLIQKELLLVNVVGNK